MFDNPRPRKDTMYSFVSPSLLQPTEPEDVRQEVSRYVTPGRSIATYFQQPCPACGRRLLIWIEHLGQQVSCSHCRRIFLARDVSGEPPCGSGWDDSMLRRAEELLAALDPACRDRRLSGV